MSKTECGIFTALTNNFDVVRQNSLLFDQPGSRGGFYDFSPLSESNEQEAVYWATRLIQGHQKIGRQVIIEIGNHDRLSPIQTALSFPDTTVVAVEVASISWDETMIQVNGREWKQSLVAQFQFYVEKLHHQEVEVGKVQILAPDPWCEEKILESAWPLVKPGGQIIMAIDPWVIETYYGEREDKKPEEVVKKFLMTHDQFEANVINLTAGQMEATYGFRDSKYLEKLPTHDIPIIVTTRKY